jgi:hypothetical protein
MLSIFAALTLQAAAAAPASAPEPATIETAAGIVIFHDMPFRHPVTLLLRAIDLRTGAFGETTLLIHSTDFAAGSGRLTAEGTVKQFHAAVLAPGTYAAIGKIERIPAEDGVVKVLTTCRPKDAEIFEVTPGGRILAPAPVGMTGDVAHMEWQLQEFLKGDDAQLEKDLAAILAANPSFGGDYQRAAPTQMVTFKMAKGAEECLKPGPAKGKIVPKK